MPRVLLLLAPALKLLVNRRPTAASSCPAALPGELPGAAPPAAAARGLLGKLLPPMLLLRLRSAALPAVAAASPSAAAAGPTGVTAAPGVAALLPQPLLPLLAAAAASVARCVTAIITDWLPSSSPPEALVAASCATRLAIACTAMGPMLGMMGTDTPSAGPEGSPSVAARHSDQRVLDSPEIVPVVKTCSSTGGWLRCACKQGATGACMHANNTGINFETSCFAAGSCPVHMIEHEGRLRHRHVRLATALCCK